MKSIHTTYLHSPIGTICVRGTDRGVEEIFFVEEYGEKLADVPDCLRECREQLREYFEEDRKMFHSLRLVQHGTDFQQRVWDALLNIPFGETVTYGELAKAVGDADAARAVGSALNRNPLAIIVPCHRVVPASGGAGEYAAGKERKEWLLKHEAL